MGRFIYFVVMLFLLSSIVGLFFGFFIAVVALVVVDCFLAAKGTPVRSGHYDSGGGIDSVHFGSNYHSDSMTINPATGLPMAGAGVDVGGNSYGFDNNNF